MLLLSMDVPCAVRIPRILLCSGAFGDLLTGRACVLVFDWDILLLRVMINAWKGWLDHEVVPRR